jgi:uncharacterized membrane protein YhiD involved in acid resistance
MRRYPVLFLFGVNTIGLAAAWWAGAHHGVLAGIGVYGAAIGLLIAVIAVLARLPRRAKSD